MDIKKRLLFNTEFTQLATGFSTIGHEIISRLYKTGKYEIAEQANYCSPEDPRLDNVPWKVYPVIPAKNDEAAWQVYNSLKTAQFGEAKFTDCLVDFKPTHVLNWSDPWMQQFIHTNPFRDFYHYIWMATIDGEPQKTEWLDLYRRTDSLCTYSEWAKNLVTRQNVDVKSQLDVGVDEKVFCPPEDKRTQKEKVGLNPDWNIVQTVMRNQPRKLYPDLFCAFAKFLDICKDQGESKLAANTFLHIHTSLQDVGWDIAAEIQKYNLGHKVLITYVDNENGKSYISFYKGKVGFSRFTGNKCSSTPNTGNGLSKEALAEFMKASDLYLTYSVCEGRGIGSLDAKSCGVPVMGIPYSATAELVIEPGGIPLRASAFAQESVSETEQLRARPDNDYTAKAIFNFFKSSKEKRQQLSEEARKIILEKYTWDISAKKWEDVIDAAQVRPVEETWLSPPRSFTPNLQNVPFSLPNTLFVEWCYTNIVGRPFMLTQMILTQLSMMLEQGSKTVMQNGRPVSTPYDKRKFVEEMVGMCNHINHLDQQRYAVCTGLIHTQKSQPRVLSI